LHLAASLPDRPPLERLYLDTEASLFGRYTVATGGQIPVPDGPGLGCDPDPDVIARFEVEL